MSERIKLPPQEWLGYDPEKGDIHGYTFVQMRQFAQLIIRECSELTLDYKNDQHYQGWLDYRNEIKKHFGVEE